jgi:hypothetical protein
MQQHEGSLSGTFYRTPPVSGIARYEVVTTPASAKPNYLVTHKLRIHRGKKYINNIRRQTVAGNKKILHAGMEAVARLPPLEPQ